MMVSGRGHSGVLAHFVAFRVVDILDVPGAPVFQTAFDHNEIPPVVISILRFRRPVTVSLFAFFCHVSGGIVFCGGFLVPDAAVFFFLRDLGLDHPPEDVILIVCGSIFLDAPGCVFFYHLPLLIIVGLYGLCQPLCFPFLSAFCLGLADAAVFVVGGQDLGLISGKPCPVLLFSGDGLFFYGPAEIVALVSGRRLFPVFSPDSGGCLGQGIPSGIGYGFCDGLTEDGAVELVVIVVRVCLRLVFCRVQGFIITDGKDPVSYTHLTLPTN